MDAFQARKLLPILPPKKNDKEENNNNYNNDDKKYAGPDKIIIHKFGEISVGQGSCGDSCKKIRGDYAT